jgi:hypothetical protein
MYPLIPEHVVFVIDHEHRQRLAACEGARALRQGVDTASTSHTWTRTLTRAWKATTSTLTGLIRTSAVRPAEIGGEGTPAGA